MDPDGFGILNTITGSICSDCTVLANQIDVVFEDGKRADLSSGVYLHHIITMDIATDRRVASNMVDSWVPFCTGMNSFIQSLTSVVSSVVGLFSQNFEVAVFSFGAVDEFKQLWTTPDGKFNSGYYLGKKDKLLMQAEIVNYNKDSKQVYLQYDIEYVKGKAGKPATTSFITTTGKLDMSVIIKNILIEKFSLRSTTCVHGQRRQRRELRRKAQCEAGGYNSKCSRAYACEMLNSELSIKYANDMVGWWRGHEGLRQR